MIGLACSLHPGGSDWEPEGATGGGARFLARAALVVALAVLLSVSAWIVHLLGQPVPGGGTAVAGAVTGVDGWAADVAGTGQPQPSTAVQFSGTEPLQVSVEHPGGLLLVRVAHRADGPFALRVRDGSADGAPDVTPGAAGPLVDVTGPYQGSRAFGLPAGTYSYRVDVPAGGQWGLSIEQPRHAARVRLPGTLEGVGDTATRPFDVGSDRRVRMAWTVDAGVAGAGRAGEPDMLDVRVLDMNGTVVAEFVARDGDEVEQSLPAGRYLLDVTTAAGVWRVLVS